MIHAAIRPAVCGECPFRPGGVVLGWDRRRRIAESLRAGESFICHNENPSVTGRPAPGPAGPRQCTGAAAVCERDGVSLVIVRAAQHYREPPFIHPARDVVPWATLDAWVAAAPDAPEASRHVSSGNDDTPTSPTETTETAAATPVR